VIDTRRGKKSPKLIIKVTMRRMMGVRVTARDRAILASNVHNSENLHSQSLAWVELQEGQKHL
jgi:hypothetical protein